MSQIDNALSTEPANDVGISARLVRQLASFSLDVDVQLPGRGVTAVFGPSGSGKTTFLRCVAGLERATHARLVVNGSVWQDDAQRVFMPVHRRPLGYVFQEASLFSHLNVQQNLVFGQRRVPEAQRRVSLEQAVELLGIGDLLTRQAETLSGGERQRVGIARALATSPRVLLMDEPLASLDLQRKAEILPYLKRLHDQLDIPVLYVSHAPDEVAQLADTLLLLAAGRVVAQGPTRTLMTRLDLPLAHGDSAAAVIDARVSHSEPAFHLSYADFAGGRLSLLNTRLQPSDNVRVRVQARDVSVALQPQIGTSVLNSLACRVVDLAPDSPGQTMVALDAGGCRLLARISQKSAHDLQLQVGQAVFAQVKSVAVLI